MRFFIRTAESEEGSIILIALLLLVLMTVVAISGSNTSVTESFIVRNAGIHQQNINLAESAALEVAQDALINLNDAEARERLTEYSTSVNRRPYVIDIGQWKNPSYPFGTGGKSKRDQWYAFGTEIMGQVLDGNGTSFPQYVVPNADFLNGLNLIDGVRGEALNSLRTALVGWKVEGGYGIGLVGVSETSVMREGKILSEYVSSNFGMTRLEVGIKREF